jgi:hypothetical protein
MSKQGPSIGDPARSVLKLSNFIEKLKVKLLKVKDLLGFCDVVCAVVISSTEMCLSCCVTTASTEHRTFLQPHLLITALTDHRTY